MGARDPAETFLLTLPILAMMRRIEGWLKDEEADLLIAVTARALAAPGPRPVVVEVGSFCGRSTVVLGRTAQAVCPMARVFAIDPHEGRVGAADGRIREKPPTFESFRGNIAAAGLVDLVVPLVKCSYEVVWDQPIRLLFIDGLHDYANVARDFRHFEPWLEPGGYVAFHDYAACYPGVVTFVDELVTDGRYRKLHRVRSLMVVQECSAETNQARPQSSGSLSVRSLGNDSTPGD